MSESLELSGPDFLKDGITFSALEEGKPVAASAIERGYEAALTRLIPLSTSLGKP